MTPHDFTGMITSKFYEGQITNAFNGLWENKNLNGVHLNEEQIKEVTILNDECFKLLVTFLKETGYFNNN